MGGATAGMGGSSVLVTGSSSGLGLETAVYLAERGFRVYATMRNLTRRHRLDAEAAGRQVDLRVLHLDVTDPASIEEAVGTVIAESGAIGALVNNAGVQLRGYFEDVSDAELRQTFETNVFGTLAVTRAVLPSMRTARRGRIVIVTSVGGRFGWMGLSIYCATKFALEGFGESLALELAPFGVRVTLVEPGIVKTDIWSRNRGVAREAANPGGLFYPWFSKSEWLTDQLVEASRTQPADVARAVHRALTALRPRLRYLVGHRAALAVGLQRGLPGLLFERLYRGVALRRVARVAVPLGGRFR